MLYYPCGFFIFRAWLSVLFTFLHYYLSMHFCLLPQWWAVQGYGNWRSMFSSSPSLCPWLPEATLRQPADGEDNAQADSFKQNSCCCYLCCEEKRGKDLCFLLGTSGDGRQDGGVSVRVAVHGRDSVPGDAQLHREGALHERREECRHHIRGRQQWYLPTGQLLPQQFLKSLKVIIR